MFSPALAVLEEIHQGVMMRCSVGNLAWLAHLLAGIECPFIVYNPPELRTKLHELATRVAQMAGRKPPALS
jgi:hypothetical protein